MHGQQNIKKSAKHKENCTLCFQ